jgi:hypothetical protein
VANEPANGGSYEFTQDCHWPAHVLLAAATWAGTAGMAHAGGPTSVLVASPSAQRATGLYHTDSRYQELSQAVGGGQTKPAGSLSQPTSVELNQGIEVRLTWLVHDVSVWRTDGIYITRSDGVWINTLADLDGGSGDLFDQPSRWHRAKDDAALLAVLKSSGILTSSVAPRMDSSPRALPAETAAAAASASRLPVIPVAIIAVVAGLAGLVLGAVIKKPRAVSARK